MKSVYRAVRTWSLNKAVCASWSFALGYCWIVRVISRRGPGSGHPCIILCLAGLHAGFLALLQPRLVRCCYIFRIVCRDAITAWCHSTH